MRRDDTSRTSTRTKPAAPDKPSGLAIEATGLAKTFGETRALDGLDLQVPAGVVYGLLGPNGAGKTTAVRVLATLLRPDAGEARVFGRDVARDADAVRARVSLTGQYASLDEDLTGKENLVLLGRLLGYGKSAALERAMQLLEAFGLTEAADKQVKKYSGGMRRRADIAASILNTPDLLFLDEPTTGLDPRSRNQVWEIVRAVVANGTTVLLTTQYLEEADRLANRIAVVDHGRVIAEGTPGELKSSIGAGSMHLRLRDPARREEARRVLVTTLGTEVTFDADPVAVTVRLTDGGDFAASDQASRALQALASAGVIVDHFSVGQPSLDEVFLALTGKPQNVASPNGRGPGTPSGREPTDREPTDREPTGVGAISDGGPGTGAASSSGNGADGRTAMEVTK